MTSRRFFFALLTFSLLAVGCVSSIFGRDEIFPRAASAISEAQRQFHEILNGKEPAPLYSHGAKVIQPDIGQGNDVALKSVHQQEGDAAQSLVELAKRQNGPANETSSTHATTPTSSSSSSSTTSSSLTTTSSPSTTSSTTTSVSSDTTSSSSSAATTSQSSSAISTSTHSSSSSTTATSTTPSSTSKGSSSTGSSSTGSSSTGSSSITGPSDSSSHTTSSGPTLTSRFSQSNSQIGSSSSTSSPSAATQSITSLLVFTSTQDSGSVVTVTELTVVPAPVAENTAGSSPTVSASLQPNGASPKSPGAKVMLCALGVVVLAAL